MANTPEPNLSGDPTGTFLPGNYTLFIVYFFLIFFCKLQGVMMYVKNDETTKRLRQ